MRTLCPFSGRTRSVKRNTFPLPTTTQDANAYWEWSDSPGHFIPYQMEASLDIECAYQQSSSTVNLAHQLSRLPYTVDLQHMYQTRHHYNTRRPIRRVPLPTGFTLKGLLKEKLISTGLEAVNVGHMAPPPPHSYAGNSMGLTGMSTTGHRGPPPPPLGSTSITLGTSHFGHASSVSIGHTPHASIPHYGHGPSSVSGHSHINIKPMVSSHTVSNSSMSTPLSSASPATYNVPSSPSASTRSKSGGHIKTAASKVPRSSQGKAVTKPKGKAKAKKRAVDAVGKASSNLVGGASSNPVGGAYGDDALLVYAKKVDRLKPKHDEVRDVLVWCSIAYHCVCMYVCVNSRVLSV